MKFLKSLSSCFAPKEEGPSKSVGRNESCWCGSGKKYKQCHLRQDEAKQANKYLSNCGPV